MRCGKSMFYYADPEESLKKALARPLGMMCVHMSILVEVASLSHKCPTVKSY